MEWIVTRDGGPKVYKGKHEGEYLLYQNYYKSKEKKASRINSDKWCEPFKTENEALLKSEDFRIWVENGRNETKRVRSSMESSGLSPPYKKPTSKSTLTNANIKSRMEYQY